MDTKFIHMPLLKNDVQLKQKVTNNHTQKKAFTQIYLFIYFW